MSTHLLSVVTNLPSRDFNTKAEFVVFILAALREPFFFGDITKKM